MQTELRKNYKMFHYLFFRNHRERVAKITKRDIFCRTCLEQILNENGSKRGSQIYNIFKTSKLVDILKYCTNLEYDPSDEYPHSVCGKCYEKILDFYQFQETCANSLEKFCEILVSPTKENNEYGDCEDTQKQDDFSGPTNYTDIEEDDDGMSDNNPPIHNKLTYGKNRSAEQNEIKWEIEHGEVGSQNDKKEGTKHNEIKWEIEYDEIASNSDEDDDPLAENAMIDIRIAKKQDQEMFWDSEDFEENNNSDDYFPGKINIKAKKRNINTRVSDTNDLEIENIKDIRLNKYMKIKAKETPTQPINSKECLETSDESNDEDVSYPKFSSYLFY